MSSILTNTGAATALGTLREINKNLGETQSRISTGMKIRSGKDNAAYFSIAKTMGGDSEMYKAIQEGMTLTKNTVSTSRMGAEKVAELTEQFAGRLAFAQGASGDNLVVIQKELSEIVDRIDTTIEQSSFNGQSLLEQGSADLTVVTGVTRSGGFGVSTTDVAHKDLEQLTSKGGATVADAALTGIALTGGTTSAAMDQNLKGIVDTLSASSTSADMQIYLEVAEASLSVAINAATDLGVSEKTLETQQDFLGELTDQLDAGVGAMIDADMETEAARLQALQVQQQLAVQSLSIANQAPQQILSLFR